MIHTRTRPRRLAVIQLQGTDTSAFYTPPAPQSTGPAAPPRQLRQGPPKYCEETPVWMYLASLLITGVALADIFLRIRKHVS